MIDKGKKEEIINALNSRAPQLECPMCHEKHFTIIDGYVLFPLHDKTNRITIGPGSFLPSVSIVCKRCGYISFHALGSLGLLPQDSFTPSNNHSSDDDSRE